MKIGIIGCGNVGFSTLTAFLAHGIHAIGYDTNVKVLERIEKTFSVDARANELLDLITCDVVFECVPTDPINESLECDLSILQHVVNVFSEYESLSDYRCSVFVQRSTCPPGTAERMSKLFKKTFYAVNPSFLTKATMIKDSMKPKRLVIGGEYEAIRILKSVYAPFRCNDIFESQCLNTVELFKYIENCTDSVLISLWNEYLQISDSLQISRKDFLNIAANFTKRERFSSALRVPSRAFGMWCLPKDIAALVHQAKENGICTEVLEAAIKTNEQVAVLYGVNDVPTDMLLKYDGGRLRLTSEAIAQILDKP